MYLQLPSNYGHRETAHSEHANAGGQGFAANIFLYNLF